MKTSPLPQNQDTPPTVVRRPRLAYRYAYARSADNAGEGEVGQDYLVIKEDAHQVAFVVCDGVSQSFFGDLAARLLGDALVDWMFTAPAKISNGASPLALEAALLEFLICLTSEATARVQAVPLPSGIPGMLQTVLEQKRALGSESTFAAGVLDTTTNTIFLAWMGDSRIRLWSRTREVSLDLLGDSFHTEERWSSLKGPVGRLHVYLGPLPAIKRLTVYSDGLTNLNQLPLERSPNSEVIQGWIQAACSSTTSDDISYFEVWTGTLPRETTARQPGEQPAAGTPALAPTVSAGPLKPPAGAAAGQDAPAGQPPRPGGQTAPRTAPPPSHRRKRRPLIPLIPLIILLLALVACCLCIVWWVMGGDDPSDRPDVKPTKDNVRPTQPVELETPEPPFPPPDLLPPWSAWETNLGLFLGPMSDWIATPPGDRGDPWDCLGWEDGAIPVGANPEEQQPAGVECQPDGPGEGIPGSGPMI